MSDNSSGSEWIYILLTILAGGFSMLKSAFDKKKAQQGRIPEREQREESYEYEPAEEYAEENQTIVEAYPEAAIYGKSEDTLPVKPSQKGDYYKERTRIVPEIEADDEDEYLDFDPRKAIIYSEILKRRY